MKTEVCNKAHQFESPREHDENCDCGEKYDLSKIIKYGLLVCGGFNGEESWLLGTRIGPSRFPIAALFDTEEEARTYNKKYKVVRVEIAEILKLRIILAHHIDAK